MKTKKALALLVVFAISVIGVFAEEAGDLRVGYVANEYLQDFQNKTVYSGTNWGQDVNNGVAGLTSGPGHDLISGELKTSSVFGGIWWQSYYAIENEYITGNTWNSTERDTGSNVLCIKANDDTNSKLATMNVVKNLGSFEDGFEYSVDMRAVFDGNFSPVNGIRLAQKNNETNYYELAFVRAQNANYTDPATIRFTKNTNAAETDVFSTDSTPFEYIENKGTAANGLVFTDYITNGTQWFNLKITAVQNVITYCITEKATNTQVYKATFIDDEDMLADGFVPQMFTTGSSCATYFDNIAINPVVTTLEIHENTIINNIDRKMFGISSDWITDVLQRNFYDEDLSMKKTNSDMANLFGESGYKLPLFRIGGNSVNTFEWKKHLTKLDSKNKSFGIPELIKGVTSLDPNAKFSVTLNIATDTDDNLLDLVRFLTLNPDNSNAFGTDGTNWAQVRVDNGILNPVAVESFVLGNELDWLGGSNNENNANWTAQQYIDKCTELIPKLREVNPNISLGVFSKTATNGFDDHGEAWNREIIKNLGPNVEFIVEHLYYHLNDAASYEQIGHDYNVIKKYISEEYNTQNCKIYLEEHGMYADWTNSEEYPRIMSFEGMMATSMFYLRRLRDPMFVAATFHGFAGENTTDEKIFTLCSEVVQRYNSGEYMLTGTGKLINFFQKNIGSKAVASNLYSNDRGFFWDDVYGKYLSKQLYTRQTADASYASRYPSTNALVTTSENGGLNILIANREENVTHNNISIKYDNGPYRLKEKTVISADSYSANITEDAPESVKFETTKYTDNQPFTQYTINPMEIVLLKLEPIGLDKSVNAVGITNAVQKNYKKTVNSSLRNIAFKCQIADIVNEDAPITVKVLKSGLMPEVSEQNSDADCIVNTAVTANAARNGTVIKMPETAENGTYTLVAGNIGHSVLDYAYTSFYYDTSAANEKTLKTIYASDEENGTVDGINGKVTFNAEINSENKRREYTYLIYKGNQISPQEDNIVSIGQVKCSGELLSFTVDMPKNKTEDGIYTLFLGASGDESDNIQSYTFNYEYIANDGYGLEINFNTDEMKSITANINFNSNVKAGELFMIALIKPSYNIISSKNDLNNVVYIDQIENNGNPLSLKMSLDESMPSGNYKLMVKAQNGYLQVFDVNYSGGPEYYINNGAVNQNGEIITDSNIDETTTVNTDIYSVNNSQIAAICAAYSEEGRITSVNIKKDISMKSGVNAVQFEFENQINNANQIKIFVWENMDNIVPLAKYVIK